jgi:hypothetical protein
MSDSIEAVNSLQEEIEKGRQTVRAEAYSMSIGEIVNLYRSKEIVIRPEFQRLFRWRPEQKARLIESLLLGIPIPSIFVMQRSDSVWEVIDGLQRLSTILEFMGELRDEETGELLPPSAMTETEYLDSLEGVRFDADGASSSLTVGQRLSFKRAKLDLKILLPESDAKAKYELFDRLNTGGSVPTPQEIRTSQLLMRDRTFSKWIEDLRSFQPFQSCIGISDRRYDEQYDLELVGRYLSLLHSTGGELKGLGNMDSFLSKKIFSLAGDESFDRPGEADRFQRLFLLLAQTAGEDAFRRYDTGRKRFLGSFSVSAFEAISVGVAKNLDKWESASDGEPRLQDRIQKLWSNTIFRTRSGSGVAASNRVPYIIPESVKFFNPALRR